VGLNNPPHPNMPIIFSESGKGIAMTSYIPGFGNHVST